MENRDYTIRDLTRAELKAASQVYMDAYLAGEREDGRKIPGRKEVERKLANHLYALKKQFKSAADDQKVNAMRGAFCGDELVGYVSYGSLSHEKKQGEIAELYVASAHRRKGVGKSLFNEAAANLREAGFVSMQLMTVRRYGSANAFYRALGGEESLFRIDEQMPTNKMGKAIAKALNALAIYRWDLTRLDI